MRALAVAAVILALASPCLAQSTAADGVCRGTDGKPTKASACAKSHKKSGKDGASSSFSRCRDVRTFRFTKCGGRYAEPVPVN